MAWWDCGGDRSGDQPAKPRPRRSVYEDPFRPPEDEDCAEWHLIAEQDISTGRWTWHGAYRPFQQTQLSEWRPFGRRPPW
jgi:hypothetical protein